MRSFLTIALATTALLQRVAAAGGAPITLELVDATNFCTFLPPADSEDRNIARTEYKAEVFCMGSTPNADAAGTLADGFIQSAHFVATDDYIQVTGQIDPVKMNLDPADEGGQYDIVMPKGAVCAGGWKHFVNLIEPSSNTYCLRCCHSRADCNRGISEKGCQHIIPGDYSGPMDGSGPSAGGSGSGDSNPTTSAPAATNTPSDEESGNPANGASESSKSSGDTATTQTQTASSTASVSSSTTSLPPSSTQSNLLSMSTIASSSDDAQPSSSNDNNADDDVTSAQSVNSESSASKVTPVLAFVAATSLAFLKLM